MKNKIGFIKYLITDIFTNEESFKTYVLGCFGCIGLIFVTLLLIASVLSMLIIIARLWEIVVTL